MEFGEILAELRQDKGLLQKDIAGIINVSVSTVSNYETGAHFPDVEGLMKLADYFNVPLDYLLGRTRLHYDFAALNKPLQNSVTAADLLNTILSFDNENIRSLIEYLELLKLRSKDEK